MMLLMVLTVTLYISNILSFFSITSIHICSRFDPTADAMSRYSLKYYIYIIEAMSKIINLTPHPVEVLDGSKCTYDKNSRKYRV